MKYGIYKDDWGRLMSCKRFELEVTTGLFKLVTPKSEDGRSEFEKDIGRVVFSQPYRRLAGKTQVHPFATVDFIHNRLTHSNEVAYASRSLGRMAARYIQDVRGDLPEGRTIEEIGWICQAAGSMHDMGNPPYGHAGESAIKAWAARNSDELADVCGKSLLNDYLLFDGNAQAFRMACRPDMRETCYYKFTAASLGAMIKYPWETRHAKSVDGEKSTAFSTEEPFLKELWHEFGVNDEYRHPLSYLTEAADDICYRINDFEDAVIMGLMDSCEVKDLLLGGMNNDDYARYKDGTFSRVKAASIGMLIVEFSKVFQYEYETIMDGKLKGDLRSRIDDRWGGVLERIKKKYDVIFSERKKVTSEIGAYGQIASILDKYLGLLSELRGKERRSEERPEFRKLSFLSQRLVTLAWGGETYYNAHRKDNMSWWGHAVMDYVVGMTDDYLHTVSGEFM